MSDADGVAANVMALGALPEVASCELCAADLDACTEHAAAIRELEAEIMESVGGILAPFDAETRGALAPLLSHLVNVAMIGGRVHGKLTRCVGRITTHHRLDIEVPG